VADFLTVRVRPVRDETGSLEELTCQLFPVVEEQRTLHLDPRGLPLPGTLLRRGMILVGKLGKTRTFDPLRRATCLDFGAGAPLATLRARYGDMWRDGCVYATQEVTGVVRSARVEDGDTGPVAVIVVERA
jgi:hypothetical protein